jgi:hypothetical protein
MSLRSTAVAGVLCIAAVLLLWYVMRPAEPVRDVAPRAVPAPGPAAIAPGTTAPAAPTTGAVPWATPAPSGAASNDEIAKRQNQSRELDAMRDDILKSMREGKQPDPKKLDAALARVEAAAGQNVVSGVNIDAVRNNLAIAQKLQVIAGELDAESKKAGKLDTDRLRALAAQVQQLQSQMRVDVSAPATPAKAATGSAQ